MAVNRALIQKILKKLFANPLKTNELGATLEFAREIRRLAKFGGCECPLNFLSEARLGALRQYVDTKYGTDGLSLEQRYDNLGHSVGTFVRHLIKASISTRGLKVERYLDHCRMPFSPVFSYTDIENYLATVQTDIETLPPMSERHKAMQIIDGVEPPWFRDMIKKKHPWALLSENIDGPEGIQL